ncbi:MAG: protein kinase family protein [Gammaproteobacteria bacterium]|nr:protein kinase family protein [Gammaproteobacteria bacterium]
MLQFNVPLDEWKIAHRYLDHRPDGSKLPYSFYQDKNNSLTARMESIPSTSYQTTHSFIKINGTIYALAQGSDSTIHFGSIGKVKYAKSEDNTSLIIKVGKRESEDRVEAEILNDLYLSAGANKRIYNLSSTGGDNNSLFDSKFYTTIEYLGSNINQFINIHPYNLTAERRLEIAIQICWQLYRLHTGLASVTHTPYAHLDLKLDNVTIDEAGHVHLIDFGFSKKFPKKLGKSATGATAYVANEISGHPLTLEQYDIIALKRILYMPEAFYCKSGFIRLPAILRPASILTEAQLIKTKLDPYINTYAILNSPPDSSTDETNAVMLCALLIAAKLNLSMSYEQIRNDKEITLAITALYFAGRQKEIEKYLRDTNAIKLIAALNTTNKIFLLDAYKDDEALKAVIKVASTHEMVCAMLYLKDLHLEQYYQRVIKDPSLAKAITIFGAQNLNEYILSLLDDKNESLVKMTLLLESNYIENYYLSLIMNPILCSALATIQNQDTLKTLIDLVRSNTYSYHDLLKVCESKKLVEAVTIISTLSILYNNLSYKILIDYPDSADAIINCYHINMDDFKLAEIIASPVLCKAINILLKAGVNHKKELGKIIFNAEMRDIILQLHSLKMEKFYTQILSNNIFFYQLSQIMNYKFKDGLTEEMLADDTLRAVLYALGNNQQRFQGFIILYENGRLDKQAYASFNDSYYFYQTIALLKEKNLTHWFEVLINNPALATPFYDLVSHKDMDTASGCYVSYVLTQLPPKDRFLFITDILNERQLKELRSNYSAYWRTIKSQLNSDERVALEKLIFTPDDLAAKGALRNIKDAIKKTQWSFGLFESRVNMKLGSEVFFVPQGVSKQIHEIFEVSDKTKSHTEALNQIKKIGQQESEKLKGITANLKYFSINKTSTEKYFDKFASDESFKQAFVLNK